MVAMFQDNQLTGCELLVLQCMMDLQSTELRIMLIDYSIVQN